MMKRFLSLLLVCVLIVAVVIPAKVHAASNESAWTELLEFTSIGTAGNNKWTMPGKTGTLKIPLPVSMRLRKVDLLILHISGDRPTAVSVTSEGSTTNLTIMNISSAITRIVGYVPAGFYKELDFKFTKATNTSSMYEVLSCKVTELHQQDFSATGSVVYNDNTYQFNTEIPLASVSDSHSRTFHAWLSDWQKYDYLSVSINAKDLSPLSIGVYLGNQSIPYEISMFSDSASGYTIHSEWVEYGLADGSNGYFDTQGEGESWSQNNINTIGTRWITLNIPIDSLDRTSTQQMRITASFLQGAGNPAQVNFVNVSGGLYVADRSNVTWWQRFTLYFSGLFDSLHSWITDQTVSIGNYLNSLRNSVNQGFTNVGSWFEQYFGAKDPDAVDDLGENSDSISQDASDIHNFEQTQQVVLDTNFSTIQNAVTFTNFAAALVFVQKYTNMTFNGISKYAIIFTLPLFLGLFFYLCSRIPGITRWKTPPPRSKPKGGGKP